MTGHKDDSDDSSISARIPVKFVAAVLAAVLFGGMGINTALFKATPSDERESIFKIIASFGELVSDHSTHIATTDSRVEALRIDILQRTSAHYTKEAQERYAQEQDRKHNELEATDEQLRRAITALERELDKLDGKR